MKLTTPTQTLSTLPPKNHPSTERKVTFAQLASKCDVPETTLRRNLLKDGITIPSTGFSQKRADIIQRLVFANYCTQAWGMISERSTCPQEVAAAIQHQKRLRADAQRLRAQLA
jgi:hypothetical protein